MNEEIHHKDTKYYIEYIYVINFPIYIYHQFADEYIVQKQPLVVFFRPATLFKIESSPGVFLWTVQNF